MDQKGKIEQNIKIEYALSALMFFSPFLKNLLKKNNKLTSEDKKFIF